MPSTTDKLFLRFAAGSGFLAVALGAFGAHGLKAHLQHLGTLDSWEKAVLYHFIHTLALLFLVSKPRRPAAWAFLAGLLLFSGSLYFYAATGIHWLVHVTPFGGVCFLLGWACLFFKRD